MGRYRTAHYRDYATAAFRLLALEGSVEAYKERIWNEALERQAEFSHIRGGTPGSPSEAAIMRAQVALDSVNATVKDLEAAQWTINTLDIMGKRRTAVKALKDVYMLDPDRKLKKGEICQRVAAASLDIPAGENSIYRWLREACALFAERRGLRL